MNKSEIDFDELNGQFDDKAFAPLDIALKNSKDMLKKILIMIENHGIDQVNIYTRRLDKVIVKDNGVEGEEKVEKLFNIKLAVFPVGCRVETLRVYDSSLVTYFLGAEKHKEPEVVFIVGSVEQGKAMKDMDISDIEEAVHELTRLGKENKANMLYNTWSLYQEIEDRYEEFN